MTRVDIKFWDILCCFHYILNAPRSLEIVQPRKTRPCLTERLLMGCKESNLTNKRLPYGRILILVRRVLNKHHKNILSTQKNR